MKSISFIQALRFAVLLSAGLYFASSPLSILIPTFISLRMVIALAFLIYINFILRHSSRKPGQMFLNFSLPTIFLLLIAFNFPVFLLVILGAVAIWGARAFYWHSDFVRVLLDALLVVFSVIAFCFGFVVFNGIFWGLLAFFGLQALSVCLVTSKASIGYQNSACISDADRFQAAYKTAQETLIGQQVR